MSAPICCTGIIGGGNKGRSRGEVDKEEMGKLAENWQKDRGRKGEWVGKEIEGERQTGKGGEERKRRA